ncbi:MAG: helix-turn-helix domain-containing protein [Bdellovibrio sp.]
MSLKQADQWIKNIKKVMKARGVTYHELAKHLSLSEASVKRVFSKGTFTLERLEQICDFLDLDFYDLAQMAKNYSSELQSTFTRQQEEFLAGNEKIFVFFYLLFGGLKLNKILEQYKFTSAQATQYLLMLDQRKLIEYHSDKKIKVLVSRNAQWDRTGPLYKLYEGNIRNEFLQTSFTADREFMSLVSGYFSDADIRLLKRKIDKLILEFKESFSLQHSSTDASDVWMLIAYRPWVFSVVTKFKR